MKVGAQEYVYASLHTITVSNLSKIDSSVRLVVIYQKFRSEAKDKFNPRMSKSNGSVNKELPQVRKDSVPSIKSKIETYENGGVNSGGPLSPPGSKSTCGRDSVGSGNK